MEKLKIDSYDVAKELLDQIKYQTVLHTIFSGQTPGWIYVDNIREPKIALAQFKQRVFLSGNPDANLEYSWHKFFLTEVKNNCEKSNVDFFRLTVNDSRWLDILGKSLENKEPIQMAYHIYQKQSNIPIRNVPTPDGYQLLPVNRSLIQKSFPEKDDLLEEMCSERESVDAFLQNSFGLAAFKDSSLAGWCLSEYNFQDQCEIGIASRPAHRKIGLAKAMTQKFQTQALEIGISNLLWHCAGSNQPSCRTALSAGFELVDHHDVLMLFWDRTLSLAVHGNIYFENQDYQEAINWYERALSQKNRQAWMASNAACAASHLNRLDAAFKFLELTINLGFDNFDYIQNSEHMTHMKNDPRWKVLINREK
ncbi:MAG: GNAT family N-acetyltransferase [Brevefilum sp.]|nr:GNAT family N-acetyltransferase [Brevefilum sp.]